MHQYIVSFPEAVKRAFTKYCCFRGRASRSEYWWFNLFNFIVMCIIYLLFGLGSNTSQLAGTIYGLAVLLPSLGLSFRRLHDIGLSGWWMIILLGVMYALLTVGFVGIINHSMATSGICFMGVLACYAAVIIMTVLPSQPRENKYGPVPNVDFKG